MKLRHLLIAAALVFVCGLVLHTPAAVIYGWTHSDPATPLRLYGVEGTLVSGRAAQVAHSSQPLLAGLRWTLKPWSLLLGRASYQLTADGPPLLLDGIVASGLGGTRIGDLKASGDLRAVAAAAGQPFVPVSGQVGVDLQRLRLRDRWPSEAEGQLRVIGLKWALAREPVALGDYAADVRTDNGELVALISTLAGVVDVNGDARLKPDRSYELTLQLRPRPEAPAMVTNLLRSIGAPDAQGYYRLRRNGSMAQ